jgi:glycosyltransferase involved in cell wall biosynthesis
MSLRVAHLSGLWRAGAGAMVRIHAGLLAAGVDSRIHSASPINSSITNSHTLPRIRSTRLRRLSQVLRNDRNDWQRRIKDAQKSNTTFEAFSPPVAIEPHDLTGVVDNIDVLHIHWAGTYFNFADFFPEISVPVVWTLHDQNPYLGGFHYQGDVDAATSMLPLEYECRDIKRESLAGLALSVVGNSNWNCNEAQSTGVLPSQTHIHRIYLPIPVNEYVPMAKEECKRRLFIDPHRFVIGFACAAMGNRRKGFVDLVSAIERLPRSMQANTTLVSFGYPPTRELRERINVPWLHLGQPSGGTEQSPIYSAMDTFVIPSLEEAFGQTALEALACQTAVVGTNVGGIPEMVINERTGLLAPCRSPHMLADCLERLFVEHDLRISCGIRGRQHAIKHHSPEQISSEYLELYRRACLVHSGRKVA